MVELNKSKTKIVKIKIIDFGFSIFLDELDEFTPRCGTVNFVAPEVISNESYDFKSDVFSLGVIMYYLLRGLLPFNSEEDIVV